MGVERPRGIQVSGTLSKSDSLEGDKGPLGLEYVSDLASRGFNGLPAMRAAHWTSIIDINVLSFSEYLECPVKLNIVQS